jgi:hypothetical protein
METVFDSSVSNQVRAWINDALGRSTFRWADMVAQVAFQVVDDPSVPGHQDYMCTSPTGTTAQGVPMYLVEIRRGADDASSPFLQHLPNPPTDTKPFFMESIIHELGHVQTLNHILDDTGKTGLAVCFRLTRETGAGQRVGALEDWNPLDAAWELRIVEAVAELFKDTYMPDQYRVYDQRTNWDAIKEKFADWTDLMGVLGGAGGTAPGTSGPLEPITFAGVTYYNVADQGWLGDNTLDPNFTYNRWPTYPGTVPPYPWLNVSAPSQAV